MTYLLSDDNSDIMQKLLNMMRISNDYSYDHAYALKYIQNNDICNRNSAVCWMKYCVESVLEGDCHCVRDTSIQIFDKFLLYISSEDPYVLKNTEFLSYAAVASIIISTKIHDNNSKLTMSKFVEFDMDRVVDIEQQVLTVTCCKISPIFTPTNFLHHMISLIPDLECNRKSDLLRNADLLIAEFWGESLSILYAPSTIAISAILVSFSLLKLKNACASWLASIPLDFFINDANPFFHCNQGSYEDGTPINSNALFLDHERCIAAFEQMQLLRSYQRPVTPVNHTATILDPVEIISTTASPVSVSTSTTTVSGACDFRNTTTTTSTSSTVGKGDHVREFKRPKPSAPPTAAGSNTYNCRLSEAEGSPPKRVRNNENIKS